MHPRDFVHLVNLRHVNEQLKSDHDTRPLLTWSRFSEVHRVGCGRNRTSTLLHFVKERHELARAYIERAGRSDGEKPFVVLYLQYAVCQSQGYGGEARDTYLVVVRKDGKTAHILVESGESNYCYRNLFGDTRGPEWKPEDDTYALESIARGWKGDMAVKRALAAVGYDLLDVMEVHERLMLNIEYVEQSDKGIEIGYRTFGTYNSLPETLRIDFAGKVNTVRLAEMGVEQPGYYSHDDHMQILSEQVDAVKAHARRFGRKLKSKERLTKAS